MAFTALYEGDERGAWSVPRSERATCPECGEEMHVVSESTDGRARHFSHNPDHSGGGGGGGGCSGGESDDHKKWKNFAAERLDEVFGDRAAGRASVEEPLAAPWSDKEDRAADACVFFENWDNQFGRGLAIEVQHKHKDKDKHAVEMDYNRQGVGVLWLSGEDFHDDGLRMAEVDIRHRTREQTSICELSDKWVPVPLPDGGHNATHVKQPTTHTEHVYQVHDPRDCEAEIPATIVADWVLPTTKEYWETEGWDAAFQVTDSSYTPTYDRSPATRIPVSIPPAIDTEQMLRHDTRYLCTNCSWRGDNYMLFDDAKPGGTALCPNCGGGLRLNTPSERRKMWRSDADA